MAHIGSPDNIFKQLEIDRKTGKLREKVLKNGGYGISPKYPEYISVDRHK